MARIELLGSLPSQLSPTDLMDRVCHIAASRGIEVLRSAPNQADFRRGSQLALRFKGAIFTNVEQFPVVAVIRCDPTATGSIAVINSLDDLGFGLRVGMRNKYTEAVRRFGALLSSFVAEANGQTTFG